ncbi:MAG: sigma-70 family RNA polymerase sigma factor [Oscillospiraceae bacterium]|nr:sigma-70 family RNA polymerase sigma factor [Oscillospiraceae bacterium]
MDCESIDNDSIHDLSSLIRQIADGRTDLFERIVLEYQSLVYTVCFNIVKNRQEAENMAQETFLSAFLSIRASTQINNLKSWLCKIAANKSIDFKRKQLNAAALYNKDITEINIPDKINVENQIEDKIRDEKLSVIISGLPEKYINAIRAFYFEQIPVKEIAKIYNLPEKTVETQLYRAKKLIRERWGEYGD